MTMIRWQRPEANPWFAMEPWGNLREEVNRLFDTNLPEFLPLPRLMNAWGPQLDLFEDKDNLVVKVEVPGMKRDDIDVSLQEGTLTISGERKSEDADKDAQTHRQERFYGRFQRSITLPMPVNDAQVKAAYNDGILTVTLPKAEEAKPKQISINVG
jgi:HSP20 family protein